MRAVWQELLPLETDKTGRWKRNSNNLASVWWQQIRTRKTHTSLAPHRLLSVFTWLAQAARVARGLECKSGDQALGALGEVGELGRSADSRQHSELVNAARGTGTFVSLWCLHCICWQMCGNYVLSQKLFRVENPVADNTLPSEEQTLLSLNLKFGLSPV